MDDDEDALEVDGRTFRPYLLTGGRTRPAGPDIPIEALVVTRARPTPGSAVLADPGPPPANLPVEQSRILAICRSPIAVAEIAADLSVPLGVARVLVSDLAAAGHVEVCETVADPEVELIQRLIAGVRAI